jgi:hypothetical protein
VDVTNKGKKVIVFIAQDGLISVFKEVAGALVSAVLVLSIPGQELSHHGRDAVSAAPKKHMDVVIHEDPGVNPTFPSRNGVAQSLKEAGPVLVVFEDD